MESAINGRRRAKTRGSQINANTDIYRFNYDVSPINSAGKAKANLYHRPCISKRTRIRPTSTVQIFELSEQGESRNFCLEVNQSG